MNSENEEIIPGQSKAVQRKRYHSPKLSNFGTVTELTQKNGMGMNSDAGMNMMAQS